MNIKYFSIPEEFEPSGLPVRVAPHKLFFHNLNHYRFLSNMCTAASEENGYLGTLLSEFPGVEDKYPCEQYFSFKAPSSAVFVGSRGIE